MFSSLLPLICDVLYSEHQMDKIHKGINVTIFSTLHCRCLLSNVYCINLYGKMFRSILKVLCSLAKGVLFIFNCFI